MEDASVEGHREDDPCLSSSLILQCSYRDGPTFHIWTIDHMCSGQRDGKWPGLLFYKKDVKASNK